MQRCKIKIFDVTMQNNNATNMESLTITRPSQRQFNLYELDEDNDVLLEFEGIDGKRSTFALPASDIDKVIEFLQDQKRKVSSESTLVELMKVLDLTK